MVLVILDGLPISPLIPLIPVILIIFATLIFAELTFAILSKIAKISPPKDATSWIKHKNKFPRIFNFFQSQKSGFFCFSFVEVNTLNKLAEKLRQNNFQIKFQNFDTVIIGRSICVRNSFWTEVFQAKLIKQKLSKIVGQKSPTEIFELLITYFNNHKMIVLSQYHKF